MLPATTPATTRWRSLARSLSETPAAIPALAAIGLMVAWATSQAGYPLGDWAPGGLLVLALVAIAALATPVRLAEIPATVRLALACLAAYTALSFCSILWAGVPGDAWEGADRTLLYLLVFALFALWRARGASAALLVCVWTLAMTGLVLYVALRLRGATGGAFSSLFAGDRLSFPAGYVNADAAMWLMAFWPALLLARGAQLPWALRGALAGGAVALADVALLSQSRGALYGTAAVLVLVLALIPQRLRTFATAVPIALAIAATAPSILRVGDRIDAGRSPYPAAHAAVAAMLAGALLTGLVVAAGAVLEARLTAGATLDARRRPLSPRLERGVRRGLRLAAAAALLGALAGGLAAAGDPLARARAAWHSFKGGYSTSYSGGTRLLSGLGSNRYDFYRVSLDELLAHPVAGIGADNFAQQYLAHGRSDETPRYPHSVELRTLAQTGALGALLAVAGLAGALVAGWRAMRRPDDPLGRTVAAGALAGFGYWAVHGSFDWFWELAGLGAPAFALLGIACSLTPRRPPASRAATTAASQPRRSPMAAASRPRRPAGRGRRLALAAVAVAAALAAACSLAAPWLSERQIESAARIWPRAPLAAYARLDDAASLNPLSDRAQLVAGGIALRFGDAARAERQFSLALKRVPGDVYATLELGAIASASGRRARSVELLRRAARLEPRAPLLREALASVRRGHRLDPRALNRAIFARAQLFK
jgi:O-antigen ligase